MLTASIIARTLQGEGGFNFAFYNFEGNKGRGLENSSRENATPPGYAPEKYLFSIHNIGGEDSSRSKSF